MQEYRVILDFWFSPENEKRWFIKEEAFDQEIKEKFSSLYQAALKGHLKIWEKSPEGLLSLIILLDQFPRQMFRGHESAFFSDPLALTLTKKGLALGFNQQLTKKQTLQFFYMPLMHSENWEDQQLSVALFKTLRDESILSYAKAHKSIIARFGRFPHRNKILQRDSTAEELAFLEKPGSSF